MLAMEDPMNPREAVTFFSELPGHYPNHEVNTMFDEIGHALADFADDMLPLSVCPSPCPEANWPFVSVVPPPALSEVSSTGSPELSFAELPANEPVKEKKAKKATSAANVSKRKRSMSTVGDQTAFKANDIFSDSSSSVTSTSGTSEDASITRKRSKSAKEMDDDDSVDTKSPQQRSRKCSSSYRGVSLCTKDSRWQARIRIKKEVVYLGRFETEEEAARRYDEAAREHHGDKALINFITPEDRTLGRKSVFEQAGGKSVRM